MTYPQGRACSGCKSSEARCAWLNGKCCARCGHWQHLDARGNDRNGRPRSDADCGTDAGYHAHRTRHELACVPCKDAHSRHVMAQRRAS